MVWRRTIAALVAAALLALTPAPADAGKRKPKGAPTITTISNRADLISAGDALVAVTPPRGVKERRLRMRLNGENVTDEFKVRPNGRFEARLEGLQVGTNALTARVRKGRGAKLEITNHPNGGPVFSGPQVQPWVCQDTAVDEQCNEPVDLRVRVHAGGRQRAAALRRGRPALGRGDHDHRRGQRGPVHRPGRDRLPGPRPVLDRRPLRPGQALRPLGSAEGLQPQAADHPRRQLRDRPPVRHGPERHRRHGRRARRRRGHLEPDGRARSRASR